MASSVRTWLRYARLKMTALTESNITPYERGILRSDHLVQRVMKSFFLAPMTVTHRYNGEAMAPTFSSNGTTLLIRPMPGVFSRSIHVGDVVLLMRNGEEMLVRRIAAEEGDKIVSTDEDEEPIYLKENYFWVLSDNESLSPKDANDSRLFGPLVSTEILGRAIYFYQSSDKHGLVQNSETARYDDVTILTAELDFERLKKHS